MAIKYNLKDLQEIMRSFYELTGIRFVLFDDECSKIISYPENECAFCEAMRKNASTSRKCAISDRKSFKTCRTLDGPYLYKCHAGLIEASLALRQNDSVVGYLMFGQMTDNSDADALAKELVAYCTDYGISKSEALKNINEIKYTDNERIVAAAKILEACMSYILLKELITPESDKLVTEAKEYIENNLTEQINISDICSHLKISRTKLYEVFKKELDSGVSEYIRKRRMHMAKKLLKNTKLPIWEIAQKIGFDDYTYFSRIFKSIYGKSPRNMRKE